MDGPWVQAQEKKKSSLLLPLKIQLLSYLVENSQKETSAFTSNHDIQCNLANSQYILHTIVPECNCFLINSL